MSARSYTDAQLVDAVQTSTNMRQVLIRLGLVPRGGNYESIRCKIAELGISVEHLRRVHKGRRPSACTDQQVADAVKGSRSLAEVLAKLDIRPGGNQGRMRTRILEMGLDTAHFVGQGWRTGTRLPVVPPRPLEEILVEGRYARSTSDLRKRLIAEGLKEHRCERCLLNLWNGQPIPLELDHANGRRDDNRIANLRMLCPN